MNQPIYMRFSPVDGSKFDMPNLWTPDNYRMKVGLVLWRFDPWTGLVRSSEDIKSDPQGKNVIPTEPSKHDPIARRLDEVTDRLIRIADDLPIEKARFLQQVAQLVEMAKNDPTFREGIMKV